MKKTLFITILCVFTVLTCMLSLTSCTGKEACDHEYADAFDVDCNLCGETREAAPKIEEIKLNDKGDTIIVTYDNGTVEWFQNIIYCEHQDCELVAIESEHYRDADGNIVAGSYIYHCKSCNGYKSEPDQTHKEIEGTRYTVDATCETPEEIHFECELCGEVKIPGEKKALGHKYSSKLLKENEQSICAGGYVYVKAETCDICNKQNEKVAPEIIAPVDDGFDGPHTVKKWTVEKAPTDSEEGLMTGKCTLCDTDCEYVLPAVVYGGEFYVSGEAADTCKKTPVEFTLKIDEKTNVSFTAEVFVKKHTVMIDGQLVEIDLENGEYDPDAKNEGANVFTPTDNTALTCKDGAVNSLFTCAGCGEKLIAKVRKLHSFEYVLGCTVEDGVYSYTLTGTCKNEGCGHTVVKTNDEFTVTVTSITTASCTSTGTDKHSVVFDESFETEQTEVSIEVATEMIEHEFHNFKFYEGKTYNKTYIEELAPIFTENGGFDDLTCSAPKSIYVPCDNCKGIYAVSIEKDHTIGNEIYSPDSATCIAGGFISYKCTECGEGIAEQTPAKGHNITKYTEVSYSEELSTYIIKGICSVCGEFTEEAVLTYSEEASTKSTCKNHGYDVYIMADGTEISIELPLSDIHVFEGVTMDKDCYAFSDFVGMVASSEITSCVIPVDARYVCDLCGTKDLTAKVIADHVYDETPENYVYLSDSQRLVSRCTADGCNSVKVISNVIMTTVDPTCLEEGSITYTYGEGKTIVVVIPANGHSFSVEPNENGAYMVDGKNVIAIGIYCTDGESKNGDVICADCGAAVRLPVYVPHKPAEDAELTVIKAPTCTENGLGGYKCPNCPENFVGDVSIDAKGHDYEYTVELAPTFTDIGNAIGTCKDCGAAAPAVVLPVVNGENYSAENTVITVVTPGSCTETGIAGYTYSFSVEDEVYSVYFEIVTPVCEYVEGVSETISCLVNEEVTFVDPYTGEDMTIVIDVEYSYFNCNHPECKIYTIVGKSFSYDDNSYIYDFENDMYVLTIAE